MSIIPAQFSEARARQFDAQFNLFRTLTGNAFDGAEKLIALNFDTTRAALEKSSALVRQVAAAKDPRDLIAITRHNQLQFESVLSYGRQLFGIATSLAAVPPVVAPALAAPVPADLVPAAAVPAAPVPATSVLAAPAPASVVPFPEPRPAVVMPAPVLDFVEAPIAEPTAIAKATSHLDELPKPAAASFPVHSSSKPIEVSPVKPVEAQPPHAPVSGTPEILAKQAEATPSKPARKK